MRSALAFGISYSSAIFETISNIDIIFFVLSCYLFFYNQLNNITFNKINQAFFRNFLET